METTPTPRRWAPMTVLVALLLAGAVAAMASFAPAQRGAAADESFARAARRALAYGQIDEAEQLARARPAGDDEATAVLARIAIRRGNYAEAETLLREAVANAARGESALELGILLDWMGRRDEATAHLLGVYRAGAGSADPEAIFRAARAARALNRPHEANPLFRAAAAMQPDAGIETAWGELMLEKHQLGQALQSFKKAIEIDERWAPAHAGLARTLADENPTAAGEAAKRALEIDAGLAEAHLVLADLELDDARYQDARQHIDRVLAVNPSQLDARALIAAIAYVRDDRAAFDAEVDRILTVNPSFGEVYRAAGALAARNYRFEEAVALTRRAVDLDPGHTRAYAELGMHLMRTGDEAAARQALDRAWEGDRFDAVTYNLLEVLDTLDKFEVIEAGSIVLKVHPEEAPILREYAVPLAQRALETFSRKYAFTPEGPILVEIFPQHDHFAVRNVGLRGLIGALGACFGRVVSMDSPRARAPGSFSWQATLWHEMAHVFTLQMSKQRVPRWLTEGVSVYEETLESPAWGREMEVPFALALERGDVLSLADLNSGFTRPETIALSYYQASLLVEHIVDTYGQDGLLKLLRVYGDGVEGEEALQRALGVGFEGLQGSFDAMLEARYASVRAALRGQQKGRQAAGDPAALRAAAAANPGSFQAQLAWGASLAAQGDPAAFEPLERAAALVPMATGENSPHALMGRLAEQLGDAPRAIRHYRALLEHDHTALDAARRLAALAAKAEDEDALAQVYARIVEIDPFDGDGHAGLGRLALGRKDLDTAIREFRVALATNPPDRATAHTDLAESYLAAGRTGDAKQHLLAALEIAPSFERAQDLLLKVVGRGPGPARRRPER